MIPQFDENGCLPPGIHCCSLDELTARFGVGSAEREVEIHELQQFVEWAHRAGVRRIIVNGSFVTHVAEPNDADIVIMPGPDYPRGHFCTSWSRWTMTILSDGLYTILARTTMELARE